MNIPKFSAEASLYEAPEYHSNGTIQHGPLYNFVRPSMTPVIMDGEIVAWIGNSGAGGGGGGGGPVCASEPNLRQLQCDTARRECQVGKVDSSCQAYVKCCGGDAGTP